MYRTHVWTPTGGKGDEIGDFGKESVCSVGDSGSIPGLGRSPGEENGYPIQYSDLEKSMDRGAWQARQSMGSQKVGHS